MHICLFFLGTELFETSSFLPYDSSQEPIFPPELKLRHATYWTESLYFKSEEMKWFRPSDLRELLFLKAKYQGAKVVNGNTELGVEMKFKGVKYPVMIQPSQVLCVVSFFCFHPADPRVVT